MASDNHDQNSGKLDYPRFNRSVPDNGYCWWYIDAISDDQQSMLTIIAFVGSVFSPYYKRARKKSPACAENHCSINVVLYGKSGNRWCMTERLKRDIKRTDKTFVIGPSSLSYTPNGKNSGKLVIDLCEKTVPIPRTVRGQIEVDIPIQSDTNFSLDKNGQHQWWPVGPNSKIDVKLQEPSQKWSGHAYVDMNWGDRPIEDDIDYWCWSRHRIAQNSYINYDVYKENSDPLQDEPEKAISICVDQHGRVKPVPSAQQYKLKNTGWRVPRYARSESLLPRIHETLEDTPFYSRTAVESKVSGQTSVGIHESVSLKRFTYKTVQAMLHFRMPRWGWRG